jgi:diguanylate cyclase (GGDEF)-like protein/PAS domain S-box-containing protein
MNGRRERLRVLFVEDSPQDCELVLNELKRAGFDVEHRRVQTQPALEEALRTFSPEVILSDFTMPQLTGSEALSIVRVSVPETPFIFVSGTIGEDRAADAMKLGATDYVLKDRLKRLAPAVRRALQEAKERIQYQQAQRALRESEERFRSFMRHLPGRASITDFEGRYTYVNENWLVAFGKAASDVLGRTHDEVWPPERVARLKPYHQQVIETNQSVSRVFGTGPGGHDRWWLSHYFPIPDAHGKTAMVGTIAMDITAQKLQEEKIARLNRIHAVLSGINSLIVRVRDRQELFNEACRIAVEHGGFGIAWVGMLRPETLTVVPVAWGGIDAGALALSENTARTDIPLGGGLVGRAIRSKRPAFSNDLTKEHSVGGERRSEAMRRGYRSVIVLPLLAADEVVGNLSLFAKEEDFFNEGEIKLLTELAGDISYAISNIALQEKLAKLSRIRAVSSTINAAIVRIRERALLLEETCRIALEQGKFELVWVASLDQERQEIRPVAWAGFSEEAAKAVSWASISAAKGTLGEAIRTRRPAVRDDIEAQLPAGKLRQEALKKGCRSTVCVPVAVDDTVVALIVLFAPGVGFFDEDELALLNEMTTDVSFALQSIERQEKLNYLAFYDALTGLPNRMLFCERLNQALHTAKQEGRKLALVFSDMKRLRFINESYGRQTGDALIQEIARRFRAIWPDPEHLARIAADCFAGILTDIKEAADVAHLVEGSVANAFAGQFTIESRELSVAMTAGIVISPTDGEDADTLCKNAEAALNKAKKSGDRYLFYQPAMNARVAETLSLENKLRKALDAEQFVLHYQPKIALADGSISGLEALIRWNDPETGLVPPARFIPLLEETGMILEAGQWAIRRALLDCAGWNAQGLKPPRVAVNVSAVQLRQKNFVDVVRLALQECETTPDALDLEITESLIMEDIEGNIEKLRAIRDMGVSIAIDDFGTGYSSLGYLAKLPVNALKIDRSFIVTMAESADSMSIVSTIISLAHSLNLKVIAEGVDSEAQSKFLRLLRCDEIQGYLISKPLSHGAITDLLREQENRDGRLRTSKGPSG